MNPPNDRPILDQAKRTAVIAVAGALVSGAVSFGFISPTLADQINSGVAYLLGAVVTVLPLFTSILHALGIVKGAEKNTTPVSSPRDDAGNPLVPLVQLAADTYGAHAAPADDVAVYSDQAATTNHEGAPVYVDHLDDNHSAEAREI